MFLDHCESRQAPLSMLLGDFNMERHQVHSGIWTEICGWSDCSSEGTCLASAAPRRIDWMLASRALQHRIAKAHLCWCTGLTTHVMQAVDISLGKPPQYLQWVPPEAYPEPVALPLDAEGASRRACHLYQADWRRAKA